MDSQTTPPPAPDSESLKLLAMLQNAKFDNVKGNEITNAGRDTFKLTVNNYNSSKEDENLVQVSSDVINLLLKVVPILLEENRKNDQPRSTIVESTDVDDSDLAPDAVTTHQALEGDRVDIVDIVPPNPSSLPVVSIADLYTRCMLKCMTGYPLYEPEPMSELSTEYLHNGVNIGDVGFVRGDGTFDFLFNICPSKNGPINPPALPDGFSLESSECSATRTIRPLPRETSLFQSPVTKTNSDEYTCEESNGAILELPEGAIREEAMNIHPFEKLAARYGVQWYEYTMTRGRKISNGSLYLITSSTKCAQWGIAVFDKKCAPGQGLSFVKKRSLPFGQPKYVWNGSRIFPTKVSDLSKGDAPNQCVFVHGYKIMIRQDIFDNLCNDQPHGSDRAITPLLPKAESSTMTRQRATRIRGGAGPDPTVKSSADGSIWSPTMIPSTVETDEVVLHADFNSSLIHPSDLINAALLNQNPNAKVALIHDDVWCDLLRDNFPKLNYMKLTDVVRSYKKTVDEYDCVSLTKISDASDGLDQRSHPLSGNDIYVSSMASFSFPRELVEYILFLLDTDSMLTCRLVNRRFNEIIQSCTALQYFLACKTAGVVDNPQSPLTYSERLEALLKWEDAWKKLKPVFEMSIKVNHQPSPASIYALTGGAYFLDDSNLKDLHCCPLPSSPQDNPQWIKVPVRGRTERWPGNFVSFALSEYEYDLMVSVISPNIGNQDDMQRYSFDLIFLKFSTGENHPLARHPKIHVNVSSEARPAIIPRIAGDNVVVIVHNEDGAFRDKLFIFDWKTGYKRLQHETTEGAYSDLVFISPELLLVPNLSLSHFEVWRLPPSHSDPQPPFQILTLKLPAVSHNYSLFDIGCNGMPNPLLRPMTYFPPRPFCPSPENSIIMTNIRLESLQGSKSASFTLVTHRRALLDTIQKWTSSSFLQSQASLPNSLTNEAIIREISDSDDGSARFESQSKFISARSSPRTRGFPPSTTHPRSPTSPSHTPASSYFPPISGSSKMSSASRYSLIQVQWADWGPPISRIFEVPEAQAQLIATSIGQRCVFTVPSLRDRRKLCIRVADFNPYNVRRYVEKMGRVREGEDSGGNVKNEEGMAEEEEELEMLDHGGVFSEELYMGLKCVVHQAPDEYKFDQLLMDEERLVGLKLNRQGRDESIKVLYIG